MSPARPPFWDYGRRATQHNVGARRAGTVNPSQVLTRGGTAGWTESIIPLQWYAGGASNTTGDSPANVAPSGLEAATRA